MNGITEHYQVAKVQTFVTSVEVQILVYKRLVKVEALT